MKKVLRDLNAECPHEKSFGLVILFTMDNGDDAETQAESAYVNFYKDSNTMYAAWDVATTMDDYLVAPIGMKLLENMDTTHYTIVVDTDEDGAYEPYDEPYIDWNAIVAPVTDELQDTASPSPSLPS